jgi:asparagine synthase (glutamine-hydrolysing)
MCGICGVIQVSGELRQVVSPETLDWMTDTMVHRGPNDRGTYSAPGVALGVRRLSIIDVDGGHQPFCNEDGTIWAVQNGELYNHDDLRSRLLADGHAFRSRCDTEVLPHLYERDGDAFEAALRGMFGIALWDGGRRRAVLARDQFGIKPLYYSVVGDLVLFASELKSLLASGLISRDLDYRALDAYLSLGYIPAPRTPLAAVSKLLPGHRLVVSDGDVRAERYWAYPTASSRASASADELADELLRELEESVRLQLMSDVPLGAMLSGGIDSSVIVALMARNAGAPVKTFSVGFAELGAANELADARLVASAFGTDHHEVELSISEQSVDLKELVWQMDEPIADLSPLGFILLCKLAAEHVTVALSGQGADELLGGYANHRAAVIANAWGKIPGPLRTVGLAAAQRGPARLRRAVPTLAAQTTIDRILRMSSRLDPELRRQLVRGSLAELPGDEAQQAIASRLDGDDDGDALSATLRVDGQLALPDDMLHYFDRASMAHSLEVRVPFCDTEVASFCASVPSSLKVKRLQTKHVLKVAARGLIPDRIIDKPKVGFFANSTDAWFRAQTDGALADWLLNSDPRYAEILDPAVVRALASRHLDGSDTRFLKLLVSILMLEIWLDTFLARAPASQPAERVVVGAGG